jgi:hypothetical protein
VFFRSLSGIQSDYPQLVQDEEPAPADADYTWKTELCACEEPLQAQALRVVLAKAGIESWIEGGRSGQYSLRMLVAADELEAARQIASQPIPQEIIDELTTETPEFELAACPTCHTPDPILEDVEPTNQWLCENCGHRWSDPAETIAE